MENRQIRCKIEKTAKTVDNSASIPNVLKQNDPNHSKVTVEDYRQRFRRIE